jgi:peptide/nickel transport system ATP-binding protein
MTTATSMTTTTTPTTTTTTGQPLLSVEELEVSYLGDGGSTRAVAGVSFSIGAGEVFGLVGESGSGKSTLAQALPRLLLPPACITGGRVLFEGRDLLALDEPALRAVRGRRLAYVPQSAMNALNPLLTVGAQLADAVRAHERLPRGAAAARARQALALVGLPPERADSFPHELSGGMRQRAVIAGALALRPALLVMDEPTAALDVLVQRDLITQLLARKAELGFAVLFISHDLPLTLSLCDRVGVLYAGRLVEIAAAGELRARPLHPYSQGLLACHLDARAPAPAELRAIAGAPPDLRHLPGGCPFHPRCPSAHLLGDRCARERPLLRAEPPAPLGARARAAACHLPR